MVCTQSQAMPCGALQPTYPTGGRPTCSAAAAKATWVSCPRRAHEGTPTKNAWPPARKCIWRQLGVQVRQNGSQAGRGSTAATFRWKAGTGGSHSSHGLHLLRCCHHGQGQRHNSQQLRGQFSCNSLRNRVSQLYEHGVDLVEQRLQLQRCHSRVQACESRLWRSGGARHINAGLQPHTQVGAPCPQGKRPCQLVCCGGAAVVGSSLEGSCERWQCLQGQRCDLLPLQPAACCAGEPVNWPLMSGQTDQPAGKF